LCPQATVSKTLISRRKQLKGEAPKGPIRLRISKTLKFWVDVAREQRMRGAAGKSKRAVIAQVLHEWEEVGEAMRYLDRNGRIAWKATQRMIDRLADAERDAKDEFAE
jgi:hypothetical protein